jgi:hypothetical protein
MSQSFAQALQSRVEKKEEKIPEGHILITWDKNIGVVYKGLSPVTHVEKQMSKAVAEIEERRIMYKEKDLENYGYDHYTKEFSYEPESDSEEEIE